MNGKSGLAISSLECERIRGAPKKSKAEIIINLVVCVFVEISYL